MIDALNEALLTLLAAARLIPGRSGKGVAPATIWRWTHRGVRGIRLETVLIGGTRFTSREAIERFIAKTTATSFDSSPVEKVDRDWESRVANAKRELADDGI